jgi:alpha-galactosidase
MKRRDFLGLLALELSDLGVAGVAVAQPAGKPAPLPLTLARLQAAPGRVLDEAGKVRADVKLERSWQAGAGGSSVCKVSITNTGKKPVRVREIIVASLSHDLPGATQLYGESFQMLSQTGGRLDAPEHFGYDESKHYKLVPPANTSHAVTGVMLLRPPGEPATTLLGFSSSRRFAGRFLLRPAAAATPASPASIDVWQDGENLALAPGETWQLEELIFASGPAPSALLATLAARINENHPPLRFDKPPTGWCSWYCFGPKVTAEDVEANLDVIAKTVPALKYVQIDDGYQPAMGDWLETGKAFGGDVARVLASIRKRGFEPAIWVAPFIAEAGSHVFKQHPDWFVKGGREHGEFAGKPLPADKVSFGGWRRGPWYVLDGTHPAVQKHFETLFTTMREKWGCTYFKLDANFWGMLHGGRYHDPKATRVEAYRRGMAAVLRGTKDAFVLGCNHPIWGSFGLVHGSRSSGDIKRTWKRVKQCARENLSRNWQNGTLWWNDSDAVVLNGDHTGNLTDDEFQFHASAIFASGGLVLSGDDLTKMPPARLAMLKKLLPPTTQAARFDDADLRIGRVTVGGTKMLCLFNDDDKPQSLTVTLPEPSVVTDFWSGASLGRREGTLTLPDMPPHSARILACKSA